MRENLRYQWWIVAAAAVVFFMHLGSTALFDMDEALYTTCAREMFQRGDWIEPRFNGEMFPEKPPLMFWTMMAGFELFGVNEWGARFFSAVLGVATALLTFHLGRILFNARIGFWAGLITPTTIIFTISARAATVDSALTFFTTAAFLLFVLARKQVGWAPPTTSDLVGSAHPTNSSLIPHPSSFIPEPLRLPYAILMYACIGVAVLGKGPVGMLLPLAAMGLFLLAVHGWRNLFRSAWSMRPLTGLLVVAAVAVPWYLLVGIQTEGLWLKRFFLEFNLRPFKQPILGHGDTSSLDRVLAALVSLLYYFYHVPAILFGFFPWAVFLGPTLVETIRRLRQKKGSELFSGPAPADRPPSSAATLQWEACVLAACWFGTWFVFWSICKTKLPHYLLPAYPALALLTACFIDRWLAAADQKLSFPPPWALRNAWLSMILVGLGILIAISIVIPIVAANLLPGEAVIGLVGIIPALGGAWCWWKTAHGQHHQAAAVFAVTSVAFLTAVFGFAAQRVDRHQKAIPMIAKIRADWEKESQPPPVAAPPIATYRFFRESTVYYAGYPVTKCDNDEATGRTAVEGLREFLAKSASSPCYVITTDEHAAEIAREFPSVFIEIFRQPRFLAPGEMIVLRAGQ